MYSNPGAIYKVHLDDTHPIGFGTNGIYYDLKQDMTLYEPSSDLWNVGAIKKDSYVTGFVGVKAKSAIQEGVVIGVKEMGAGKFVFMADDPIFRNFWEAGKLILANEEVIIVDCWFWVFQWFNTSSAKCCIYICRY